MAVELHRGAPQLGRNGKQIEEASPEQVLGVQAGAGPAEIRQAYRAKALAAHPDKGGDPTEFCRVRRAYLALSGDAAEGCRGDGKKRLALGPPEHAQSRDFQLRSHRELVKNKFKEDGVDLRGFLRRQSFTMRDLNLECRDNGATNTNEQGEKIYNQCFYLSLARSYLGPQSISDTALGLKRVIEAAVLSEHPDWGGERVGEDVQAFSDFLVFVLGTNALLSELAVAVFDAASGTAEVYVGRCFPSKGREAEQRSNLLTLMYKPGHYVSLVPRQGCQRPSFRELLNSLVARGTQHVVTYV